MSRNEEVRKVRGGSSGLAAAIQRQKAQAGGLQELRNPSPRETRAAKAQSLCISTPSPKLNRVRSATDDSSVQSNGSIPRPALGRPISMVTPRTTAVDSEVPPPKPPRTGSTSPSAFLSLERGEYLHGNEDDDDDDEEEVIEEGVVFSAKEDNGVWVEEADQETWQEVEINGIHSEDLTGRDSSITPEQDWEMVEAEGLGRVDSNDEEGDLEKTIEEEAVTTGKMEVKESSSSPVKKPLLPPSQTKRPTTHTSEVTSDSSPIPAPSPNSISSTTSDQSPATSRRDSDGKGAYPKVPLLPPPGGSTSPLINRTTPSSTTPPSSSKKSPLIPKASPPSSDSRSSPVNPRTHSSSSTSSSVSGKGTSQSDSSEKGTEKSSPGLTKEERLQRENELLKRQLLLLQGKIGPGGKIHLPSSEELDPLAEMDDPLTTDGDDEGSVFSRPRSRSVSPCEGEGISSTTAKIKPIPQPRTRSQTVTTGAGSRAPGSGGHPLPYGNTSAGVVLSGATARSSSVTTPLSSSAPKGNASPIPKPRSNLTPKLAKACVGVTSSKAASQPEHEDVACANKSEDKEDSSGRSVDVGEKLEEGHGERSSSASSNNSSSSEKAKAAITLQKLLPRNSSMPQAMSSTSSTNEQGSVTTAPSYSGTKLLTSSQSDSKAPSSSPKPIPTPRSGHPSPATSVRPASSSISVTIPAPHQERPAPIITTTASATNMGSTSQTRNQTQAMPSSAPHSSSVPPTSFLSQTGSTPTSSKEGGASTTSKVKAPLQSTVRAYSSGRSKYKKVTMDDASWIKRKASLESERSLSPPGDTSKLDSSNEGNSVDGATATPTLPSRPPRPPSSVSLQTGTGTGQGTAAGTNSGSSKPVSPQTQPYRSHAILPAPKTVSQPFINPHSPSTPRKTETPPKPLPPKQAEPPKTKDSPPSPRKPKKRIWGRKNEEAKEAKKDKETKKGMKKSGSKDDVAISISSSEGNSGGKKGNKKAFSQSQMVDSSKLTPARPNLPKKMSALDRPVSMMVDNERQSELTASATVSMPRGLQAEDAFKQQKQKKGLFGRKTGKSKSTLSKLEDIEASGGGELPDASDSGSDDEKGGTIKKMPKLRHVSVKRPDNADEDAGESEYHQLFEYVFVVSLKEDSKKNLVTETTYTFPPTCTFKGKDSALQSIPQFCYPDIDQWKPTKSYESESFSFVLTDIEGNRRFGYCRRLLPDGDGPRLPEVYCIISPLGCFSLYENILDHVEERRKFNSLSVFNFLKAISANPFPRPGRSVTVKVFGARGSGMEPVTFTRPVDSRLEHVDFSILFSTLSHRKIIKLFSSLLMERRVIFCASSLSLMTGCAHALMALLYPFEWQHVFIPVLPSSLIDFVCSPLPYIIGMNPTCCQKLDQMDMDEAVVINLEKSKFIKQIGDENSILPSKLFQFLEGKLGASIISTSYTKRSGASKKASNTSKADELVVNTFMTFFAYLYGDYQDNMKLLESGQKEFQRTEHIKKFKSKSTRRFLEAFQMTQMFESFVEMRELPSKAETLAASLFEQKLPELKTRCQDIEIFSSKSRFDRWKMKKDLAKGTD